LEPLSIAEEIVGAADCACVAQYIGSGRQVVAVGADGVVRCWDVAGRRIVAARVADGDRVGRWLTVDPSETRIGVAYAQVHRVRSWSVDQIQFGRETLARHGEKARAAVASPSGDAVATVGDDGVVQVFDRRTKTVRWSHRAGLPHATAVGYSPDGARLLVGRAVHPGKKDAAPFGEIWVYDAATGEPLGPPHAVPGWVWQIQCSQSGEQALLAMGITWRHQGAESGQAAVVELSSGRVLRAFPVEHVRCRRAVFSPDEKSIATASETEVAVWNAEMGVKLKSIAGNRRCFVRYVDEGRSLLTAEGPVVELRDAESLALRRSFQPSSDRETAAVDDAIIGDAVATPDGERLVSASWNGGIAVWDFASADLLLTERAHEAGIHYTEITPDGSAVITAGHDGFVRLWDSLPTPAIIVP
jgi:WD40 repeat protein